MTRRRTSRASRSEVAGYVKTFGEQEQEHVDALTVTIKDLGGTPVKAPGVDFGDAFSSADKFIALAITFEDTGVSAYNGAAPMIESKDLLATAGGIVQVEARHAAAIRFAAGEDPAPEAFDPSLTEDEVLKAVAAVHPVMTVTARHLAALLAVGGDLGRRLRRQRRRGGGTATEADDQVARSPSSRFSPGDGDGAGRHEADLDELRRRRPHRDGGRRLVRHRHARQGRQRHGDPRRAGHLHVLLSLPPVHEGDGGGPIGVPSYLVAGSEGRKRRE